MKSLFLKKQELDAIPLNHIILSIFAGGDDVLVLSGEELKNNSKDFMGDSPSDSLWDILTVYLQDTSGNSFELVAFINGELVKILLP